MSSTVSGGGSAAAAAPLTSVTRASLTFGEEDSFESHDASGRIGSGLRSRTSSAGQLAVAVAGAGAVARGMHSVSSHGSSASLAAGAPNTGRGLHLPGKPYATTLNKDLVKLGQPFKDAYKAAKKTRGFNIALRGLETGKVSITMPNGTVKKVNISDLVAQRDADNHCAGFDPSRNNRFVMKDVSFIAKKGYEDAPIAKRVVNRDGTTSTKRAKSLGKIAKGAYFKTARVTDKFFKVFVAIILKLTNNRATNNIPLGLLKPIGAVAAGAVRVVGLVVATTVAPIIAAVAATALTIAAAAVVVAGVAAAVAVAVAAAAVALAVKYIAIPVILIVGTILVGAVKFIISPVTALMNKFEGLENLIASLHSHDSEDQLKLARLRKAKKGKFFLESKASQFLAEYMKKVVFSKTSGLLDTLFGTKSIPKAHRATQDNLKFKNASDLGLQFNRARVESDLNRRALNSAANATTGAARSPVDSCNSGSDRRYPTESRFGSMAGRPFAASGTFQSVGSRAGAGAGAGASAGASGLTLGHGVGGARPTAYSGRSAGSDLGGAGGTMNPLLATTGAGGHALGLDEAAAASRGRVPSYTLEPGAGEHA